MKKILTAVLTLLLLLTAALPVLAADNEASEAPDAASITERLRSSLDEIRAMSDEELAAAIRALAEQYHIPLTDGQVQQLLRLCRSVTDADESVLEEKLESAKAEIGEAIQKAFDAKETLADVQEKASGIWERVSALWDSAKEFFGRARDFLGGIRDKIIP